MALPTLCCIGNVVTSQTDPRGVASMIAYDQIRKGLEQGRTGQDCVVLGLYCALLPPETAWIRINIKTKLELS